MPCAPSAGSIAIVNPILKRFFWTRQSHHSTEWHGGFYLGSQRCKPVPSFEHCGKTKDEKQLDQRSWGVLRNTLLTSDPGVLLFHEDLSVFMYKTIIELHFAESYLKRGIWATQTFHCTIITTDKGIWPKFRADTLGSKSFRDSSILGQSPIKVTYCKGS